MNTCKKCGTQLCNESVCRNCGTTQESPKTEVVSSPSTVYCPKCGSHDAQYCVENDTHTEGKNFSAGKGCLGYLLLGPLGLLCGLCGKGKKTVTVNSGYWICKQCGNKFKDRAELQTEAKSLRKKGITLMVAGGIFVVLALFLSGFLTAGGEGEIAGTIAVTASFSFLVFALAAVPEFIKYGKLKKELG